MLRRKFSCIHRLSIIELSRIAPNSLARVEEVQCRYPINLIPASRSYEEVWSG
ncbi:hypothetical protein EMIT0158MI4_160127 [Burkholderia ambifaria]